MFPNNPETKINIYSLTGQILWIEQRSTMPQIAVLPLNYIYLYKKKDYATYNNKNAIISANKPVASEKAKPRIA